MLTKEDLLVCSTPPNIKDVSLELYKEFAEEYIKQEDLKIVNSLEIKDEDGNVIDAASYEFILE